MALSAWFTEAAASTSFRSADHCAECSWRAVSEETPLSSVQSNQFSMHRL
nr:hypothetical protein [Streptomyces endocoffeicus]